MTCTLCRPMHVQYVCITGGHLNPCITLVSVIEQKIHLMHAFGYIVAQLLGAFLANACVYGVYKGKTFISFLT